MQNMQYFFGNCNYVLPQTIQSRMDEYGYMQWSCMAKISEHIDSRQSVFIKNKLSIDSHKKKLKIVHLAIHKSSTIPRLSCCSFTCYIMLAAIVLAWASLVCSISSFL